MKTVFCLISILSLSAQAQEKIVQDHHHHHHHGHASHGKHVMAFDSDGMVMHENYNQLPDDCSKIEKDVYLEVRAGRQHARTGFAWGFDKHQWNVPPCSRINVTLINEDSVRHQWMVHGLPKYLYPQGMFHLEAGGKTKRSGIFIVPSDNATYLAHCDIAQHMEKGLKAQLVVGRGAGNLSSVPGITSSRR